MFGSPSDIVDERDIFFDIVHGWNHLHSEKSEIVLLPIHWSKDSYVTDLEPWSFLTQSELGRLIPMAVEG